MKSSGLVPYLPEDVSSMTIRELLQSDDTEITKKGKKLKLKRDTPESTIYFEYTEYEDGHALYGSQIPTKAKKKELATTVRQMREEGMTYQEISKRTGMSTTYARHLCIDD